MADPLADAVAMLHAGRLVAFPTETVYGLGADARNSAAVRRIYDAKGRPPTNPLIVHVADAASAQRFTRSWPEPAEQLSRAFWPGPLTLVLPKTDEIVPEATAGRPTVGLRVPDHPIALELLRRFHGPIAAPSANRSNTVSPTTAQHVRDELGKSVDLILDGGSCDVGIESTVLDLTAAVPVIRRPGRVTRERIESLIGAVEMFEGTIPVDTPADSPGQQPVHYAPAAPAYRFEREQLAEAPRFPGSQSNSVAWLILENPDMPLIAGNLQILPSNPEAYAQRFYAALRWLDAARPAAILIELPPDRPEWLAVRDRILRATRPL